MIPFLLNENRFFFVADHLLVGQLCTNPKSDRSPLSCLTLPAPSKCKSGLPRITGTCPGWWKSFRLRLCLWCGFKWGLHHAISHLQSQLESQHQSVPRCAEECGDLVQSGGWWQTLGVAAGLSTSPQVQRDPGLSSEGVLQLCTLLSLPRLLPRLEPVWSYVKNNMTSHNTNASLIAIICRAPAGACRKGMLPVLDPYQGGDWGWRWLHWIDVSSTR